MEINKNKNKMKLAQIKNMRTSDMSFFSGNTQPTSPGTNNGNVLIEKVSIMSLIFIISTYFLDELFGRGK